jgi:hypothetical protein
MVGCGGSSNNPDEPPCNTADAAPATGICTAAEFNKIRDNLTADYKLLANIDLSDYAPWTPIGTSFDTFEGTLDGKGHTVSGLTFQENSDAQYIGLFGYINGADIENLKVKVEYNTDPINLKLNGEQSFGIIAGYATGANLAKITVSSAEPFTIYKTVNGKLYAGGLVGYVASSSSIEQSYSSVTFKATNNVTSAISYVGGIAGLNNNGEISNSYTTGDISANGNGETYAGGIVGHNKADINNTYATGDILANDDSKAYAGGIAGKTETNAKISNSVALNNNITASGVGTTNASRIALGGGLNNFALATVALKEKGLSRTVSSGLTSDDGASKDSGELTTQETWSNSANGLGWDFGIWKWVDNRPVL